ncbi:MAG: putative endonuclease [Rhodospirillaceae bacterium]|jgi:putative endonuclease|nr:putative endonuclease [Rhodospirillaceae bacterium]
MTVERRRAAWRRGRRGEMAALVALVLRGYRILARDLRSPVGEIDIVARRGRAIVFIEVKARGSHRVAAEALLGRQRRRIARAAARFLAARPELAGTEARFDVILVAPWRWPRHLIDAWRIDW